MTYSSAILGGNVPGPRGPTGSTGPRGFTGNPGISGSTGSTGPRGKYVVYGQAQIDSIVLYYSDGTTGQVYGNFYGATGQTGTAEAVNTLPTTSFGYNFILGDTPESGIVAIKGISALGSLVTSIDNNNLYIDTIYTETAGNLDSPGLSADTLMYLKETDLASSTDIKITAYTEGRNANLNFRNVNFLNDSAHIKTVGPVKQGQLVGLYGELEDFSNGTTDGIYVKLQDSGFYIVKTPIGIAGFTGEFRTNEILSATLVIESDQIWKFPENVYFEPGENYLTCGKSIVNILTFDGGINWYATISQRGLDIQTVTGCLPAINTGSCCYTEYPSNQTKCKEYVTKDICDRFGGSFKPLQACTDTCFTNPGVCCTSGKCLENVSITECEQFGGQFFSDTTCSTYPNNPEGDNYAEPISNGRFCFDPCKDQVSCCKNGVCLGNNYSRIQCEQVLGGVAVPGTSCVGNKLCCDININGACCLCDSSTGQNTGCVDGVSKYYCDNYGSITGNTNIRGTFVGEGESCSQFNCSCICPQEPLVGCCFLTPEPDPTQNTYCPPGDCGYSFSCFDVTRQWCIDQGGTPHPQGTKCELNPGSDPLYGEAKRCFCEKFAGPQTRCCNSPSHTGDDNCVIIDPCTCQELGGISGPYGTICSPNACGDDPDNPYVCCTESGCIQTETQEQCTQDFNGTVLGEGDCADFTCEKPPPPTVACCNNGQCTDKTPEECTASGGTRAPAGTSCSTYQCQTQPQPRTCCFTGFDGDVTCQDLIPEICIQQGGVVGASGSSCAIEGCSGPDEFVACFWCFPDVTEINPYRPGKFYNPHVPNPVGDSEENTWITNPEYENWAKHNSHASQAPYRSVIVVSPEKKRLLDLSVPGVTIEWGGIAKPGLKTDYPMFTEKPIAEMINDSNKGYHYLENFSSLPWLSENDPRKKVGNVDPLKNPIMGLVYKNIGGNVISAGGTFYCSYIGSYANQQNNENFNANNKTNCLKRFGYTGDYLSVATLCDEIMDDDGAVPEEIPLIWEIYNAENNNIGLGIVKNEPYLYTIKSGLAAPFPPIWGRITYTNGMRTCEQLERRWGSANLNILPQNEVLNMLNAFKGGKTGSSWWKNYFNKVGGGLSSSSAKKLEFYNQATIQLNKQLGFKGNAPYKGLWKRNLYGNPAPCTFPLPGPPDWAGRGGYLNLGGCACNHLYSYCPLEPYSVGCFPPVAETEFYKFPYNLIEYDPLQISSNINLYSARGTRGFDDWGAWNQNLAVGPNCFLNGWNGIITNNEEEDTAAVFGRLGVVGLGWKQLNEDGTVLYADGDGSDNRFGENTAYGISVQDFSGGSGLLGGVTGRVHWSGNFIHPPRAILENNIREIYYKHGLSDIQLDLALANCNNSGSPGCQSEAPFARGILGRNLRYNLNKFPTAGVFFEGTSEYSGEDIWKDSSFMYHHRSLSYDGCNPSQRQPGAMAVVVPIFGFYWLGNIPCSGGCNGDICEITLGTGGGTEGCFPGYAKITECSNPGSPYYCSCYPNDTVCNCENRSYLSPEELASGEYTPGTCFISNGDYCILSGPSTYRCCQPGNCNIIDNCDNAGDSNFTGGDNFAGGGGGRIVSYTLNYPRLIGGLVYCSSGVQSAPNVNTKFVKLEDNSCVEMLCPECNDYPECS